MKCGYFAGTFQNIFFKQPTYHNYFVLFLNVNFRLTTVIVVDCSICFWYYLLSLLLLSIEPKIEAQDFINLQGEPSKSASKQFNSMLPILFGNPVLDCRIHPLLLLLIPPPLPSIKSYQWWMLAYYWVCSSAN